VSLCCGEEGLFHGKTSIIKRLFSTFHFFLLPDFTWKGRSDRAEAAQFGEVISVFVRGLNCVCGITLRAECISQENKTALGRALHARACGAG